MKLEEYLKTNNISKTEFAKSLEISLGYVSNICKGCRSPSLDVTRRIIQATDGEVAVGDLFNPEAPTRLKSRKKKYIESTQK